MQLRLPYLYTVLATLAVGVGIGASTRVEVEGSTIEGILYILVLTAGLSMGRLLAERGVPSRRATVHGSILGLAVMAAGGVAGFLVGLASGVNPRLTAFSGAASGWYSLAGPLVSIYDPILGLAAFTSNLFREALHIGVYPIMAGKGYRCASVSLGGATTMDTGLPVVVKYGGLEASLTALSQGIIITALAPFTATLLLG